MHVVCALKVLTPTTVGVANMHHVLNETKKLLRQEWDECIKQSLADYSYVKFGMNLDKFMRNYKVFLSGGRLVSAINRTNSFNDYDIFCIPESFDAATHLANKVFSISGPTDLKTYFGMSRNYIVDSVPNIKPWLFPIQIIIEQTPNSTISDITQTFDLCHCRIAYNLKTEEFVYRYPDLYCLANKFLATSWEAAYSNLGITYHYFEKRENIFQQRVEKYKSRGFRIIS